MAGMAPGVLLAVALMVYVALVAGKRNYPKSERMKLRQTAHYFVTSIPAILTPVILLVGIYTGIMTPTEAGAVAGLYALLVAVIGYRVLKWEGIKKAILETVESTGSVALMVGAAQCFSYIVARENIAGQLGEVILSITANKHMFLLLVNIVILILGMFIDTNTIQLVLVPMLLPVATALGIDLVHFGVVVSFNMMIGLSTPPFGMLLFITSGISGTPLKSIIKEIWLPLGAMLIVLIIITYIPDTVLMLPKLLIGYGA